MNNNDSASVNRAELQRAIRLESTGTYFQQFYEEDFQTYTLLFTRLAEEIEDFLSWQ